MRTIYLGTSAFASAVLEHLAGAPGHPEGSSTGEHHRPALVVTRPDRPAGRGRKLVSPPVADVARELGIELSQPESVNDSEVRSLIAGVEPDVVVVCAFGALIKEPLLSEYEMLNVHPSLLPRWRGAAPIERAIMAGDGETGVSIMRLTAGLDSGPVCALAREAIQSHDTYGSLAPRLARRGSELLIGVLDAIEQGQPPVFAEQDERNANYAEKITVADRLLDPSRPAVELERVVRALSPHIGARVALSDGRMLGVLRAEQHSGSCGAGNSGVTDRARQGVFASDGRLRLSCVDGALELLVVQPPGGRPMDAAAFLRGHGLPA